jgi:hypothetical protein
VVRGFVVCGFVEACWDPWFCDYVVGSVVLCSRAMKVWIPSFSGDGEVFGEWLVKFEYLAKAKKWLEEDKRLRLPLYLEGDAFRVYVDVVERQKKEALADICEELDMTFPDRTMNRLLNPRETRLADQPLTPTRGTVSVEFEGSSVDMLDQVIIADQPLTPTRRTVSVEFDGNPVDMVDQVVIEKDMIERQCDGNDNMNGLLGCEGVDTYEDAAARKTPSVEFEGSRVDVVYNVEVGVMNGMKSDSDDCENGFLDCGGIDIGDSDSGSTDEFGNLSRDRDCITDREQIIVKGGGNGKSGGRRGVQRFQKQQEETRMKKNAEEKEDAKLEREREEGATKRIEENEKQNSELCLFLESASAQENGDLTRMVCKWLNPIDIRDRLRIWDPGGISAFDEKGRRCRGSLSTFPWDASRGNLSCR